MDFNSVLPIIKTEGMRKRLENLAHSIGNNYNSKLVFTENTCTNGSIMQINPSYVSEYPLDAIFETCEKFHFEKDPFKILFWDAKSSTIHESGHDAFSDFNIFNSISNDFFMETKYGQSILKNILNIIEDAFIENAMCSMYNGAKKYILFSNTLAFEARQSLDELEGKVSKLDLFMEYFTQLIILQKTKGTIQNEEVLKVIKKCEPLFKTGAWSLRANVRYEFAKKIFAIIKNTIYDATQKNDFTSYSNLPADDSDSGNERSDGKSSSDTDKSEPHQNKANLQKKFKLKNGDPNSQKLKNNKKFSNSSSANDSELSDGDNSKFSDNEKEELINEILSESISDEADKEVAKKELDREIEDAKRDNQIKEALLNVEYSKVNNNIIVKPTFPDTDTASKYSLLYSQILSEVSGNISAFVQQFKKLIQKDDEFETGLEIGDALDSSRFGRKDRTFWKEEKIVSNPTKLSITILVDGSGSIEPIVTDLQKTCIILYEVAKKLKFPISIIEQRAIYKTNIVESNVKMGYKNIDALKYNIASLKAEGGTREGVSLLWTYDYMKKACPEHKHLFIVLSDGEPEHTGYTYPLNIRDSHASALIVEKDKNCKLIAVCLDQNSNEHLKKIYKNVVDCSENISFLPFQLVKLIKKAL